MASEPREVNGLKVHGPQFGEVAGAELRELIQQLREGFALGFVDVSVAIQVRKWLLRAVFEHPFGAREPVGALAVDEVSDDVECAPGVFAFVAAGSCGGGGLPGGCA